MTTKRLREGKVSDNGEPLPGDAHEPETPAVDTGFEPSHLEEAPSSQRLIPGIDLDACALEEDYQESMGSAESSTNVVVRKPNGKLGYFRVHPTLWKNVRMLEVGNGEDRGFYLVTGGAKAVLQSEENEDVRLFPARLTLCYGRDVGLFLWPLRLAEPKKDNQIDEWSQSALRICEIAKTRWVKLYTKRNGSCYSHRIGEGIKAEPSWPNFTLTDACNQAFEKRYLTDPDDNLIRRLLGKE